MEKVISKRTKIILGIIILGLVVICIYQSYAIFKESRKLRFIWGVVEDFEQTPDIVINVFVDGEKEEKFPTNNGIYHYEKLTCTNSGNALFDEDAWQMAIKNITEPTECDIHFISIPKLKDAIMYRNELNVGTPDFIRISTNEDTGLWSYPEYSGTSYYFRGTKELLNNNVIFAGFQWKIIRIDYLGNIKLIYNGKCLNNQCDINKSGEDTVIGKSRFNEDKNDSNSIGYTITNGLNQVDSLIKTYTENWYQNNLSDYDSNVADVIYCNDRSYGLYTYTFYGAALRLASMNEYNIYLPEMGVKPSLNCSLNEDKYTQSSSIGNGYLGEKIGHITADEATLAGTNHQYIDASSYYLSNGLHFYTLSPLNAASLYYMYILHYQATLHPSYTDTEYSIRPVIALSSNVEITKGNGSEQNPYIVKIN